MGRVDTSPETATPNLSEQGLQQPVVVEDARDLASALPREEPEERMNAATRRKLLSAMDVEPRDTTCEIAGRRSSRHPVAGGKLLPAALVFMVLKGKTGTRMLSIISQRLDQMPMNLEVNLESSRCTLTFLDMTQRCVDAFTARLQGMFHPEDKCFFG